MTGNLEEPGDVYTVRAASRLPFFQTIYGFSFIKEKRVHLKYRVERVASSIAAGLVAFNRAGTCEKFYYLRTEKALLAGCIAGPILS